MSYNYNQYPYTNYAYGQPYQQYQQMQSQMQQAQMQQAQMQPQQANYGAYQQAPQTSYLPLTFINGIEGAKAFIVQPNQVIYLKDSDSNLLFEKRADAQGKYSLIAFELKEIQINEIGKKNDSSSIKAENLAEKKELENYLTLEEFSKYEIKMNNALDRLTRQIDLVVGGKTIQPQIKKED